METPIIVALIAAAITFIGWIVQRRSEETFRRMDARRKYFERQIEEFYGPLFTITQSIFTHYEVLHTLTKTPETRQKLTAEQLARIESFYEDTYFIPLHERIEEILRTKLYLIDSDVVPKSFFDYLEHSLQARAQRMIFIQLNIGTQHVEGTPWPEKFSDDIKQGFDDVMRKYENATIPIKRR